MDGEVVIGTRLDTKQLEKDLKQTKKDLSSYEREAEKLTKAKAKAEVDLEPYRKQKEMIQQMTDESLRYAQSETEVKNQLNLEKIQLEELNQKYSKQLGNLEEINRKIKENATNQEKVKNKIEESNKKLNWSKSLDNIKGKTEGIGNSINNVIKKITRWGLAVFGIRSAYNAIRGAMSTLSQYNENMANQVEYIQYALASTLQPVIQTIINLVLRLMSYINYLTKAWFGKEIFASAKDFERMKNASSGVASNVEKAKKSLAGFDEMNVLEDTSSSSGASAGGSTGLKLEVPEDIEPPKWLEAIKKTGEWIKKNWKGVLAVLGLTGGVLAGIKLATFIKDLKSAKNVGSPFKGLFDGLGNATEIIAILGGLALVIPTITELIDTFNESGMTLGETAGLLGIALGSLATVFTILLGAMTLLSPSWESIASGVIVLGGMALILHEIADILKTVNAGGYELGEVGGMLAGVFTSIIALITAMTIAAQFLQNPMAMGGLAILIAGILSTLLVMAATLPIILDAVGKFINTIAPTLIKIIETIYRGIQDVIYALGTALPPIINSVGNVFKNIFNGIAGVIQAVGNVIVNIMRTADTMTKTVLSSILTFINQLGPAINNFVDNAIRAVTKLINFLISGIEYTINTLIINSINSFLAGINKIPGVDFDPIQPVSIARFRPVLMASGGILNMPGQGIYKGGAITGEAGPEGQVPLTNDRSLEIIGETIARHVSINLTNITQLDNRQIAREQKRINAQQDFAYNR